jgi:hypothetical protein
MGNSFNFGFSGEDVDLEDEEMPEASSPGQEKNSRGAPDTEIDNGFAQPALHSLEDLVSLMLLSTDLH